MQNDQTQYRYYFLSRDKTEKIIYAVSLVEAQKEFEKYFNVPNAPLIKRLPF